MLASTAAEMPFRRFDPLLSICELESSLRESAFTQKFAAVPESQPEIMLPLAIVVGSKLSLGTTEGGIRRGWFSAAELQLATSRIFLASSALKSGTTACLEARFILEITVTEASPI
ncbi:MAG: hypothetical protein ABSE46_02475 [Terracidiphilus sp.]